MRTANRPPKFKIPSRVVRLPCCGRDVVVTSRASKIRERPRNHQCPGCGKAYRVGADGIAR